MLIEIRDSGFAIVPETDFEKEYLRQFNDSKKMEVYLKFGLSLEDDLIELRIKIKGENDIYKMIPSCFNPDPDDNICRCRTAECFMDEDNIFIKDYDKGENK